MSSRRRPLPRVRPQLVACGVAVGLVGAPLLLVAGWLAGPVQAAPAPITIVYGDLNGFRPQRVTVANGGSVRWTNSGGTTVTITGHNAVCDFSVTVTGFATSAVVGPFPSGGTCAYGGDTVLARNTGSIIVGPRPGPSPPPPSVPPATAPPTHLPGPSTGPAPSGSPEPVTPSASGSPQPSPTPGRSPGTTGSPQPGHFPTDSGVAPVVSPDAGGPRLRTDGVYIGHSPHRAVGLLGAVSLILVAGLVAALLRVLLAEPVDAGQDAAREGRPIVGGSS